MATDRKKIARQRVAENVEKQLNLSRSMTTSWQNSAFISNATTRFLEQIQENEYVPKKVKSAASLEVFRRERRSKKN